LFVSVKLDDFISLLLFLLHEVVRNKTEGNTDNDRKDILNSLLGFTLIIFYYLNGLIINQNSHQLFFYNH
jgi:hypothetical protein